MRAIIFDLDGVLIDSEPLHHAALMEICDDARSALEYTDYVGRSDADAIRLIHHRAGRPLSTERLDALLDAKRRLITERFLAGAVSPYVGTLRLLEDAIDAGLTVGVCSASRGDEVRAAVDALDLTPRLACVVSADDVARPKPDPAGYRLALEQIGVDVCESVAIEDSVPGLAAAKGAGLRVAAVLHTTERSRLAAADMIVESSDVLTLDLLRSLFN